MTFNHFSKTGGLIAAMLVLPGLSLATTCKCVAGKPTPESYTWNFKREATNLLTGVQQDAAQARSHAAKLQSFADNPELSWESHADQLSSLKAEINDMGAKLCRLETIRRVAAPWQQEAIDRVASAIRLMADNTQDAITYVNDNRVGLWTPTYRKYADNLYGEAGQLSHEVKQYEEFAKIHKEDVHLGKALGIKTGS